MFKVGDKVRLKEEVGEKYLFDNKTVFTVNGLDISGSCYIGDSDDNLTIFMTENELELVESIDEVQEKIYELGIESKEKELLKIGSYNGDKNQPSYNTDSTDNKGESIKMPLGLIPDYVWVETIKDLHAKERVKEITDAITRYIKAKMIIPVSWMIEYNELMARIETKKADAK